jgi:hypothetical protein
MQRSAWPVSRPFVYVYIAQRLRKEGDSSDPYVVFQNLPGSGRFDELMREFELERGGDSDRAEATGLRIETWGTRARLTGKTDCSALF